MNAIWHQVPVTRSDVRRMLANVRDGQRFDAGLRRALEQAMAKLSEEDPADFDIQDRAVEILRNRALVAKVVKLIEVSTEVRN